MRGALESFLRQSWPGFGLGPAPAPGALQVALISGGQSVHNKLVCPVWRGSDELPCLIAKFPRHPAYNSRMGVEHAALTELARWVPGGPPRAPRPLALAPVDGLQVALETALPGRTLLSHLREHSGAAATIWTRMAALVDWLGALQARSARPATDADLDRLVWEPLDAAPAELDLDAAEAVGIEAVAAEAKRLPTEASPIPLVYCHNDLSTVNVLVDRDGQLAGIVDWESAAFGFPATDLCYFLARLAYELRAAGTDDDARGYRELFFGPEAVPGALAPALAARPLASYLTRLGIDAAWLPVLFCLGALMHARNEQLLIGLHAQGELLHLLPTTARAARGHFRGQLAYFLHNRDRFLRGGASA